MNYTKGSTILYLNMSQNEEAAGFNISDDESDTILNTTINTTSRILRQVPEPPSYLVTTATVFYVIIFILGVFGNIVVIVVILANKNMKSTVNMFLINLCVADLLVLVICMPPTLVELHMKEIWYFGKFMCKLVPFLEFVVASASIFTIVTISIERYRVVCHPLSVTKGKASYFISSLAGIWILAGITSSPMLSITVFKNSRLKDGTPIQVCRIPVQTDWQKAYFISNAACIYFVPFLALSVLYFKLCQKLVPRQYHDETSIEVDSHTQNEKLRLRWQVIHIISTVVCVFFICHLPYRIISIWMMLESKRNLIALGLEKYIIIIYSARILLYLNHALNPFIYNFVSTKFRMSLRFLISTRRKNSSYLLCEKRKDNETPKINTHVRFKKNSQTARDKTPTIDHESKSSSSDSRGKINDFSPLYANVCDIENQDIMYMKETSLKYPNLEQEEGCNQTPSFTLDLDDFTPPAVLVKLRTTDGYLLGITVERINNPKLTKSN